MAAIYGTTGSDALVGTPESDTFYPSWGIDTVDGLGGSDTLVLDYSSYVNNDPYAGAAVPSRPSYGVTSSGGSFAGTVGLPYGGSWVVFSSVENLQLALSGSDDVFIVDAAALGLGATVYVNGGQGYDRLIADLSALAAFDLSVGPGPNSPGFTALNFEEFNLNLTSGADRVSTGWGADVLKGNGGNDVLNGGAGADRLEGGSGNDLLYGEDGNDRLDVGTGYDVVDGGTGLDTLVVIWGDWAASIGTYSFAPGANGYSGGYIEGTTGEIQRGVSFSGIDRFEITTGSGSDVVTTGNGDDIVSTGAGNDIVDTGSGDDFVDVGSGDDSADGGAGLDRISADLSGAAGAVTYDLVTGAYSGPAGNFSNFEGFGRFRTGSGNDELVTSSLIIDETIETGGGNDRITVRGGRDVVAAGAGTDTLIVDYSAATGSVQTSFSFFSSQSGTLETGYNGMIEGGWPTQVSFSGIERFEITTNNAGAYLQTGRGDDRIVTGSGMDQIAPGGGNDYVDAGAGEDRVEYGYNFAGETGTIGVIVNLSAQVYVIHAGHALAGGTVAPNEAIDPWGGRDTLIGFENVSGSGQDDVLIGSAVTNALYGRGGDDRFVGGAGMDFIAGDEGVDLVDYSAETGTQGVVVNLYGSGDYGIYGGAYVPVPGQDWLAPGRAIDSFGDRDYLSNVEQITTGGYADLVHGSFSDNRISLGAGDDRGYGWGGSDLLIGAEGDDQLYGGFGTDLLQGGEGNDRLEGGADNDGLDGGAGDDVLIGGAGDDDYSGGDGTDTLDFSGEAGPVSVNLSSNSGLFSNSPLATRPLNPGEAFDSFGNYEAVSGIENLILTSRDDFVLGSEGDNRIEAGAGDDAVLGAGGNDLLLGGAGSDSLLGGGGDDRIEGGGDDDELSGGDGDDRLDGGSGTDTALYNTAAAGVMVTLRLPGDAQNTGGAGVDTLIEVENLVGSQFADTLIGNDYANVLDGRGGADTMRGSWGDDVYFVDDSGDLVDELAGEGVDTIRTSLAAYSLVGTNVENLTATSNIARDFRGNSGNNVVTGGGGNDVLRFQDGGNDSAVGGAGNDVFLFGATMDGLDAVDGGSGIDQIALQGGIAFTFGTGVVGLESIGLLAGNDTRFGDTAGNLYSYDLTTRDVNVAAGVLLTVDGAKLRVGENLTFNGSAETDGSFFIYGGRGVDTLTGGAKNDTFLFGSDNHFGASDTVNGGAGIDQLALRGSYSLTFGAGQLIGIESIGLLSAQDTRYGALGTSYNYNLTMNDANVAAGVQMVVDGAKLRGGETLVFNGSAESDGSFQIFGGANGDTITGSQNGDVIQGNAGADILTGGGGADSFRYKLVTDSSASATDHILDFTSGTDKIDLSRIDANTGLAGDQAFTWIGSGAFTGVAGQLRVFQSGTDWLVQGDVNGDGVADLVIQVSVNDGSPVQSDFFF
jgi:Ca2+-binding RTX toxin-like protein